MIKHQQTTFGTNKEGDTREPGNCFSVAIACILEMPIEDIPNFCVHKDWFDRTNEWLKDLGFCYIELDYNVLSNEANKWWLKYSGYSILVGDGARGCKHAVVGFQGEFFHDPHPSGDGLLNIDLIGFFIPLEPNLCTLVKNVE